MFHPKLAKSEMWHCVSFGKLFQSRERDPGRDPQEEVLWSVWARLCGPLCVLGAADMSHAGGSSSRNDISHKVAFRLFTVEMPLDPW